MSRKLDRSEADLQWLLGELDRVWFHDNALSFHMGDWIRSLRRSSSWPIDCNSSESRAPIICPDVEQQLARTLRETGRVFSTGDLPKALLVNKHDQDESSEATAGGASPDSISEQGAEDYQCDEEFRKLETIPSASALVPFTPPPPALSKTGHETTVTVSAATTPSLPRRRRRKQRRKQTRSLSELEFDELRGFRDLGFKFTKDDMTPRVVGLIQPHGFKRESQEAMNNKTNGSNGGVSSGTSNNRAERERIYPSHAWSIRRPDSPLLNLRLPDPNEEGVDMKAHLKFWARTVASTVRQEC